MAAGLLFTRRYSLVGRAGKLPEFSSGSAGFRRFEDLGAEVRKGFRFRVPGTRVRATVWRTVRSTRTPQDLQGQSAHPRASPSKGPQK